MKGDNVLCDSTCWSTDSVVVPTPLPYFTPNSNPSASAHKSLTAGGGWRVAAYAHDVLARFKKWLRKILSVNMPLLALDRGDYADKAPTKLAIVN
jgi:hypothetical protein